jgi:outer membrane protein TolC
MKLLKYVLGISLVLLLNHNLLSQTKHLEDLINEAIVKSPKIKMLQAKLEAASNRININSNLPDPMLTLGLVNMPVNSFSFTQEPMTGKIIGLSQSFPFPGKLSAISEAVSIDTLIIRQEINDAINEIRKTVSTKFFDLSFTRKALLYSSGSKKLLEKIAEVVSTKYTVSSASQQNLIKVQLEITYLEEKIENLKSKENSLLAQLNALLYREPSSNIGTAFYDKINYITVTVNQIDSLAKIYRPYLNGIKYAEEKAKINQEVANKEFYPHFTLGLQYSFRDKIASTNTPLNNFFSVVLGISLPLNYGGKVSSKVEEFIATEQMYSEQYAYAIQTLNGNFGSMIANLQSIEEIIRYFSFISLPGG